MKLMNFLMFTLVFTACSLSSQNYDFNTYTYRFQRYRGLNTNVLFNGVNNITRDIMTDNFGMDSRSKNKKYYPAIDFNAQLTNYYFHYISTDRLQQTLSGSLNLNTVFYSRNTKADYETPLSTGSNQQLSKTFQRNLTAELNLENRFYRSNKQFYLLSVQGSYGSRYQKNKYDIFNNNSITSSGQNLYTENKGSINLKIGYGKGRLEYVSDAVMAYFLLRDMKNKANVGEISNDQIESVAKGITRIRNRRFTDFRFQLIGQVEFLDTILKNAGIRSDNQLRYYTTLYDNWLYATNLGRYSGKRFSFYGQGSYTSNSFLNDNNTSSFTHIKRNTVLRNDAVYIGMEYIQSKQLSYKVQRSLTLNFIAGNQNSPFNQIFEDSIGTDFYKRQEWSSNVQTYNVNISGIYSYLYQPNTRTYLILNLEPGFIYGNIYKESSTELTDHPTTKYNETRLNASLDFFRFINARISFWANVSQTFKNFNSNRIYGYNFESDGLRKTNSVLSLTNYSMGLRYAIF